MAGNYGAGSMSTEAHLVAMQHFHLATHCDRDPNIERHREQNGRKDESDSERTFKETSQFLNLEHASFLIHLCLFLAGCLVFVAGVY